MEVVSESLKVFIPCNLLQRGIEELPLSNYITHIHIFKSLKNTSAIGFGVNMVHGHKEDASFQKCRITLLQVIYRAGQGQSPRLCDSTTPAGAEHPVLFIRIEERWGGAGRAWGGIRHRKENRTQLFFKLKY